MLVFLRWKNAHSLWICLIVQDTKSHILWLFVSVLEALEVNVICCTWTPWVSNSVSVDFLNGMLDRSKKQGGWKKDYQSFNPPLTWQQQSQLNSVAARFLDFLLLSSLLFHSPDLGMVERGKFALLNCIGLLEGRLRTVWGVILRNDGTV